MRPLPGCRVGPASLMPSDRRALFWFIKLKAGKQKTDRLPGGQLCERRGGPLGFGCSALPPSAFRRRLGWTCLQRTRGFSINLKYEIRVLAAGRPLGCILEAVIHLLYRTFCSSPCNIATVLRPTVPYCVILYHTAPFFTVPYCALL
jgi:hypothetical protein